jgi:adenylate cyclase
VGDYSRDDLARRAGVDPGFVDRLVECGILSPPTGAAPYTRGDVRRARFTHGLTQGGVPLEAVGEAMRSGTLSLAFFDASYWDRFGALTERTYRELSEETGLGLELLLGVRESMGFARPEPDDAVREDELEVVGLVGAFHAMGSDSAALEGQIRTWGESLRRIAEADRDFYRSQIEAPLLEAGLSWSDMLQVASDSAEELVPFLDPALLSMYHAQSEHTWFANMVEAVEASLESAGLYRSVSRPPAMCFLDLSGFTRLTEERGDEAAAEMSASLGKLVQRASHGRGGRPVKSLGDGVMVYFPDPTAAVLFALEMQDEAPVAHLPRVHAGIAAGPLVFQDGDYFGRTVNMASRIAARAAPGQVLVNADAAEATTDPGVEFFDMGSVELRGVSRAVNLLEARRRI